MESNGLTARLGTAVMEMVDALVAGLPDGVDKIELGESAIAVEVKIVADGYPMTGIMTECSSPNVVTQVGIFDLAKRTVKKAVR